MTSDPVWLVLVRYLLAATVLGLSLWVLAHGVVGCGLDFLGVVTR